MKQDDKGLAGRRTFRQMQPVFADFAAELVGVRRRISGLAGKDGGGSSVPFNGLRRKGVNGQGQQQGDSSCKRMKFHISLYSLSRF